MRRLLLAFILIVIVAAHAQARDAGQASPEPVFVKIPEQMTGQQMRDQVVQTAFSQLGLSYKMGGTSPGSGFDCSGYTRWVFEMTGVKLPRTSREQFTRGMAVDRSNLQPGDMVFFRNGRSIGHVGIYVEGGYFIHSPNKNSEVTISSLTSPGWSKNYAGARRIIP